MCCQEKTSSSKIQCRRKHGSHIGKQNSPFHIRQFLGSTTTQNLYKSIYHLQVDDLDSLSGSVHWNTHATSLFSYKVVPQKMNRKHTWLSSICCLWNWGNATCYVFLPSLFCLTPPRGFAKQVSCWGPNFWSLINQIQLLGGSNDTIYYNMVFNPFKNYVRWGHRRNINTLFLFGFLGCIF